MRFGLVPNRRETFMKLLGGIAHDDRRPDGPGFPGIVTTPGRAWRCAQRSAIRSALSLIFPGPFVQPLFNIWSAGAVLKMGWLF